MIHLILLHYSYFFISSKVSGVVVLPYKPTTLLKYGLSYFHSIFICLKESQVFVNNHKIIKTYFANIAKLTLYSILYGNTDRIDSAIHKDVQLK